EPSAPADAAPASVVPSAAAAVPATAADSSVTGDGSVAVAASVRWQCQGPLRWRGGDRKWSLAWQADEALTRASTRLINGNSEMGLQRPLGDGALAVTAKRVPGAWLKPVAPKVAWQAGRIDGRVELSQTRARASRWRGQVAARSLSAEASGGSVALADIDIG